MSALTLVTAPVRQPIGLDEAKSFLVLPGDVTDQDPLLNDIIAATVKRAEEDQGRAYITQTWDLKLDEFPAFGHANPLAGIDILRVPLQSVTHVKYYDTAGVEQTVSSSDYVVDAISDPARVCPAYDEVWPEPQRRPNAVTVRFVAGYGDTPASLPTERRIELLELIARAWESRGAAAPGRTRRAAWLA